MRDLSPEDQKICHAIAEKHLSLLNDSASNNKTFAFDHELNHLGSFETAEATDAHLLTIGSGPFYCVFIIGAHRFYVVIKRDVH